MKSVKVLLVLLMAFAILQKCSSRPFLREDVSAEKAESSQTVPEFILRLLNCLNSKNDKIECLHFTGKDETTVKEIIDNPDTVWGFVGNGTLNNPISFQIQDKVKPTDIHSVDLVLHKQTLTESQLDELSTEKCNFSQNGLKLQLESQVEIIKTIDLSPSVLLDDEWISFQHLDEWYIKWIEQLNLTVAENTSSVIPLQLKVKLLLNKDCPSTLTYSDFGIEPIVHGYEPLFLVYSKVADKEIQIYFFKELQELNLRKKRATVPVEATSSGTWPEDLSQPCQLVSYNTSYKYIQSIPLKGTFELNFCRGHCHHPVQMDNMTNHAILLAWMNANPKVTVKPGRPCCSGYEYKDLAVVRFGKQGGMIEMATVSNMTVSKCTCR